MPIIILSVVVLTEFITGNKGQNENITFLDFENDFGGWNISFGNWNRSTISIDFKFGSQHCFKG